MAKLTGNSVVWFSGGRKSAYLLHKLLLDNGGALPDNTQVVFANTGREDPGTLAFIAQCSAEWNVPVTVVEYRPKMSFAVVEIGAASCSGAPFDYFLRDFRSPPSRFTRNCIRHLKFQAIHQYLESLGWDEWTSLVGICSDEPHRYSKMLSLNGAEHEGETFKAPLRDDGVSKQDVADFWDGNAFQHPLPAYKDKPILDGCDLCFLKPITKIGLAVKEDQSKLEWWGSRGFVYDGVKYADLLSSPALPIILRSSLAQTECGCPC